MATTHRYLSGDSYFQRTTGDKIIINHLAYLDSASMESMLEKLITVYDSDVISTIPTCSCGTTKGRYLLNVECQECGTSCTDPKDKKDPILWFESLDPTLPFIDPAYWNSLSTILSTKVDLLRWLTDPQYNPPTPPPNYIVGAKNDVLGGVRSYQALVANLSQLILYLYNSSEVKSKSRHNELLLLNDILIKHPEDIFSSYLPTPNNKLLVIENTTKGKYTNLVLGDVLDVVTLWMRVANPDTNITKKSSSTAIVISKLGALYLKYYDKFLFKKPGAVRKHLYGARSHFTFRTVITASIGKHKHDHVIAPWLVSVTTYRPHLLNKLIKRGYSYKEADKILNESVMTYHPVIDELQDELINESPNGEGLPLLVHRNPGLLQGSSQYMKIPKFNKDPGVMASTFSPLAAKAPNADYDGDRNLR